MKLKNIIFDFDGVIVDTYDFVFDIVKENYPEITQQDFKDLYNQGISKNNKISFGADKKFFKYFFEEYNSRLNRNHIFPDAIKYLNTLNNEYNLFLITSGSEVVVTNFLDKLGWNFFDKILGHETSKSKVIKFKLLEGNGMVSSENSVFITDTLADIVEGQQAGYKVLAETFGYHNRERLAKGKPEWIVDSWEKIIKTITQINN